MFRKFSRFQNFAQRAMQHFALLVGAVLILGIGSSYAFGQSAEQSRKLARLEATYLTHLTKYVQWDNQDAGTKLKIIVHGDDRFKFSDTLRFAMKISTPETTVEILSFSDAQQQVALDEASKGFNFLVLLKNSSISGVHLSELKDKGVLVVHGQKRLNSLPAQVAFEYNQNRVRMLIDREAIGDQKNRISSKLTELKSAVKVVDK
ncbi:MAG TPA: hypothetical protein DCF87_01030 [Opitutae bacterium]|nr:hypothetical protein [Opitutae bacterium]